MIRIAQRAGNLLPFQETDWAANHPEWWSLSVSVVAWFVLLLRTPMPGAQMLCLARPDGVSGSLTGDLWVAWETGAFGSMLVGWLAMTLAMMPPLAIPLIRHVAVRSFAVRRQRAILEFLTGAVIAWMLLGLGSLALLEVIPRPWGGAPAVVASGFLVAALWQLTPMKRLALLRCHHTFPLAAVGWRADLDCAKCGFGYGQACVASCGAMMLATVLDSHSLMATLFVQVIALAEQRARQPRPWASAMVLAACAAAALAPILLAGGVAGG